MAITTSPLTWQGGGTLPLTSADLGGCQSKPDQEVHTHIPIRPQRGVHLQGVFVLQAMLKKD